MKRAFIIAAAVSLVVLIFFDVNINPRFALPRQVQQVDAAQEKLYDACVDEKDRIVHGETFAAIDNPDVQREVLATRMEAAVQECRQSHPEMFVTVDEPFRLNLLDFRFRY